MANINISTNVGMNAISPLGVDYAVATSLTTGIFNLYTPFTSGGVAQNLASLYVNTNNGTVQGSPTITNSGFQVNTGGTDYVNLPGFNDVGAGAQLAPDMTCFVVVETIGTPNWIALSSYGADIHNSTNPGTKGFEFAVQSSTSVAFKDFHGTGSGLQFFNTTVTVPGLASGYYCYAFQRGTVGSTVTRNVYNLTSGTSQNTTDTVPAANNITQNLTIGATGGGNGATCNIPLCIIIQSPQGGGAFLSAAQINQIYARIKTRMANLPTPVVV